MEKVLKFFSREYKDINQAALLLGAFTFLSQILGLFRDRAIAHFIGPGAELDAYYAAFRVPDLVFILIGSLVSATVLVPFLLEKMRGENSSESAQRLFGGVFFVLFFMLLAVSVLAFLLMPSLVPFIAPGFSAEMREITVTFSRVMLLSPLFLGLSSLFGSVTQIFRKFFLYALSPVFYNLGIIFGIVFGYPVLGMDGLVWGVVLGALLHFLVQLFSSTGSGFGFNFFSRPDFREIRKIFFTSLPRTLSLASSTLALVVIVALASFLEEGSISVFNLSFNLQSVPLNIIGMSYAVAAFPTLARSFAEHDQSSFATQLRSVSRQILFWSLPVIFLFIVLRAQIVRVILGSGSFSWEDTRLVAASLALFALSVPAQSLVALFSRAYHASGDTRRPLLVNFFSSALIVGFSFFLVEIFKSAPFLRDFLESLLKVENVPGTEVLVFPLAYSLGLLVNFFALWFFARRDFFRGDSFVSRTFWESLGASFVLSVVAYASLNILSPVFGTSTFLGIFLQGFISGILGISAAAWVLYLLKNEEFLSVVRVIQARFWRKKISLPLQGEV